MESSVILAMGVACSSCTEEGLPERNGRNIGIRSFELARLMSDQKRYEVVALADIYEEYGSAIEQSGEGGQAARARAAATALREANQGRQAEFKPVRYLCNEPQSSG